MKVKIEYTELKTEEIEVDDKYAELVKTIKEAGYPWNTDAQARNIVYDELEPRGQRLTKSVGGNLQEL